MKVKVKYCDNEWCLEHTKKNGRIIGILKTKQRDIQICSQAREWCPDGKWHYFNYKPQFIKSK